jgi:hypothetical protein
MLPNLKALVVVLMLATVVFVVAKPVCLRFMDVADFNRRRNVWFILTVTAFAGPSFWFYVLVAVPVLLWAGKKDKNPIALVLLLLHVVPPGGEQIPSIIVNQFFELDNYRILSLCVLVPNALRLLNSRAPMPIRRFRAADLFIFSYLALQIALLMPYESITNTMRRTFLFSIDALVLYFVASRVCRRRQEIVEAMACFCLVCAIFVPIAVFENLRGWLLYLSVQELWQGAIVFSFLMRGDALRASASAGHSIPLGYMLAVGFGFWLYLSSKLEKKSLGVAVSIAIWVGMIAAQSRAPWLTGAVIFFAYLGFGPNGLASMFKAGFIMAPVGALVLASSYGEKLIAYLPFVGTVDVESVSYRQRLAELSWDVIQRNPFFGDPYFLMYLEELRVGGGVIDLMNSYASVAMSYGLVGLALLLGFFVSCMSQVRRVLVSTGASNQDLRKLGACLLACMVGTLFMMATGSFGTGLEKMFYVLAGLATGFGQLTVATKPSSAPDRTALSGATLQYENR